MAELSVTHEAGVEEDAAGTSRGSIGLPATLS